MKNIIIALVAILLSACSLVQKRQQFPQQETVKKEDLPAKVEIPLDMGEGTENLESPDVKTPKVGIILTPAGARSYAFIGVLREFEKAKIPVQVVGGQEWGALMAGLYSVHGKTNDVEWKAFKIPEDFAKKGFLSSTYDAKNFSEMHNYLKILFENKRLEEGKIPFACVTQGLKNQKNLILLKGLYRESVGFCMAYPPILESYNGWVSGATQTKALLQQMAIMGVDYFVLVDAVTATNPLGGIKVDEPTQILWTEVVRDVQQNKKFVHQVVQIPLAQSVLDFGARKEMLKAGEVAGQAAAQKIVEKFGL